MYLRHPHTFKHFRERWEPTLVPRMKFEQWVEDGSKSIKERINDRLDQIMRDHKPRPIPATAKQTLKEIIERARSRAVPR